MRLATLACLLPLCACVEAAPPMVSDYNGNLVKLVYHNVPLGNSYKGSPLYAKAVEVCGRDATYQGMRQISEYQGEHAFLCVS